MKITRQDIQSLVVIDFPYLIGILAFPTALFLIDRTVVAALRGERGARLVGPAIGALLCFFGGAVFTKRSVFEFDLLQRELRWKRRGVFSGRGGAVPLDEIHRATLQSMDSGDGPTYRVTLLTDAGELPLTDAYSSGRDAPQRVCDAINKVLTASPAAQTEDDIQKLARAGQKIEAIRLARARYGYDLSTAKDFVEGLLG